MHDSCVVVSLLKAIPIVLTAKILVISEVAKGLAPWASVWYGGECPHAYRLKSLTGGSYMYMWYMYYFIVQREVGCLQLAPQRPPGTDLKVGTESRRHEEVFTGRWSRELRVIHTPTNSTVHTTHQAIT